MKKHLFFFKFLEIPEIADRNFRKTCEFLELVSFENCWKYFSISMTDRTFIEGKEFEKILKKTSPTNIAEWNCPQWIESKRIHRYRTPLFLFFFFYSLPCFYLFRPVDFHETRYHKSNYQEPRIFIRTSLFACNHRLIIKRKRQFKQINYLGKSSIKLSTVKLFSPWSVARFTRFTLQTSQHFPVPRRKNCKRFHIVQLKCQETLYHSYSFPFINVRLNERKTKIIQKPCHCFN